jgi:hypothetical protein
MVQQKKEGWGFPPRGGNAHYFVNNVSLCNDFNSDGKQLEPDLSPKCPDCEKKLAKRGGTR